MIVEYWLADYIGRAWPWLRARRNGSDGHADCRLIAHGGSLPAGRLWAVQLFAASAWTVAAMACAVLFAVTGVAGVALPRGILRDVAGYVLLAFVMLAIIAIGQIAMISYRGRQTQSYVRRGGSRAAAAMSEPRRGQPRAKDFWITLLVAILWGGGILLGMFINSGH